MDKLKMNWQRIVFLLKSMIFVLLVVSFSGCSVSHKRSTTNRKKGLMLLENTSQSLNKKYKKTRFAKKAEKHHKKGKR